jgi:hypothetical protein
MSWVQDAAKVVLLWAVVKALPKVVSLTAKVLAPQAPVPLAPPSAQESALLAVLQLSQLEAPALVAAKM